MLKIGLSFGRVCYKLPALVKWTPRKRSGEDSAMAATAREVAKWFIARSNQPGEFRQCSNKKLQKLVYYAQAWHLALYEEPLFEDEIEAWIHGPVVPNVYREYKKFGYNPIAGYQKLHTMDEQTSDLLNQVWEIYGSKDANYLEFLTHSELPWQATRATLEADERSTAVISHELMQSFYSGLLKTEDDDRQDG